MWFPDGQRIFFSGSEQGRALRSYMQDLSGGALRPLTPEGTRALSISPDGQWVAAIGPEDAISLWPVAGGASRRRAKARSPAIGLSHGVRTDGRSGCSVAAKCPPRVDRLEIATGRRELWKTLLPPDAAGVYSIIEFRVTPTGHSYFYSYTRLLSQLFLVTGLQ